LTIRDCVLHVLEKPHPDDALLLHKQWQCWKTPGRIGWTYTI